MLICALVASLYLHAQKIEFGEIEKDVVAETFYPLDSSANAAYLNKYRKTYYRYNTIKGFSLITEYFYRIKIYNKDGFDYANFVLKYLRPDKGDVEKISNIKGYTYNIDKDGKVKRTKLSSKGIFEEKLTKYRSAKKISMPDIREGSVIDLKYKLISPYPYSIDDLRFQTSIPIKHLYTKIEIPEWIVFNKMSKGYYNIIPQSSERSGNISFYEKVRRQTNELYPQFKTNSTSLNLKYNIDVFEADNIPALLNNEPYISNVKNYYGGLKYELTLLKYPNSPIKTFTETWEDVSKKIYKAKGFGRELEKKRYFKNDLTAILNNTSGDIQKAIAIFEHVKNKVKWNEYTGKYVEKGVKSAYKNGTGNAAEINLILTAMLRESGLEANPVLVSTRNNGVPLSPTLDGFNYVVSLVEFPDGKTMVLDATDPYSTPNVLPVRALNWNGRKVTKEGYSTWINLNPPKHSSESNTIKAKISPEGSVTGLLRKSESMLNAFLTRKRYNHVTNESVISKLEEKYNTEIESFRFNNKKKLYKPISQTLKFSSEDLIEEINGKLLFNPLLFLTDHTNPFKAKERKFPVDFASAWKEQNNVSIEIPEGYKVENLPEQLAIGLPDNLGFFKYVVQNQGNIIKVNSIIQINSAIIPPSYYQNLKEFYNKMVAKQNEKIVLIKG